jgi:hypothetical protein
MLKHKSDCQNILRSILLFLLLFSILIIVGWVGSTDGVVYTTCYASDYGILNGTHVSGSIPSSVTSVDSDYFIIRSVGTDTSVNVYNPGGYTLLGSTSRVSGSISNFTSNDGVGMVFSSYFSGLDMEDYVDNNASDVDGSSGKGIHSDFSAQRYGPDLINDILTEEITAFSSNSTWLYVNADDETRTGWTRNGTNPYLDAIDYSTNYVWVSGNNLQIGDFGFADSGKSTEIIDSVTVQLYAKQSGTSNNLEVFVWDGFGWASLGVRTTPMSWGWMSWTATMVLDTWSKVDGAKMYIQSKAGAGTFEVDCARLNVDYSEPANCELDLEVQWTSVDFDELNEELCINGGAMGAENLRVDVWNFGWENLFADLNSGWNNVSITSYLDSSTFTIRFKGGNETGDTTQDTWNIDAVLLHVWHDQYAAEVEFAGSSNTYNWKQLNWTFDSAWTTDSVSVTIQLYNFTLGDYSTSGNGFISYTSSATANIDETKILTVTKNPQHFRDVAGNWKIMIRGVKNTTTSFDSKVDWVEFEPTYWSEYTISTEFFFSNMTSKMPTQLNFTVVSQYSIVSVAVTIQVWNYSASAYATSGQAYLNHTSSGTNETKTLSITVNPLYYTSNGNAKLKITGLSSSATQYQQEVNQVKLRVNTQTLSPSFDWFTTLLYVLPFVFGFLFLLALLLKRKKKKTVSPKPIRPPEGSLEESKPKTPDIAKKTDAFSGQFGITHEQIVGKKMLLEIDPASDYHKSLLSFVSEAENNNEPLFIFTNKNSTLHSMFSGTENVNFRLLTSKTSSPQQIDDRQTLLPASDLSVLLDAFGRVQSGDEKPVNVLFDNLSDIILSCGFEKAYKFMRLLLETISSPKATSLFVFNPTAHDQTISSSIRGLFKNQLAYTKSGPKIGSL